MPEAFIKQITLPSGSTYTIKDEWARTQIGSLAQTIAGGVAFIIAWDGTSAPTASNIPAGVVINYNSTTTTGTLSVSDATAGAFYLVKSATTPSSETLDIYDEYVVIKPDTSDDTTWYWEKIGDTKINLTDVVTDVTLSKQTDTVIGSDATFTITQPTVALSTGATAGTGVISVATGVTVDADPSITLTANASNDTGRITYVESQGTATTTKISASAAGGAVSASGDNVTALTGLGSPSTKNAIGARSTFTITQPTITIASGDSGDVTVATGGGTSSTTNTDWLKNISVLNEVLTIGAATLNQTHLGATASGANTAWNNKDSVTAVTGYANTTSDTVLGTSSTFNVTDPTITIASGSTGDVTVATGINNATTKYMSASASGTTVTPTTTNIKATASGANTAWNNKDQVTVLTNSTDVSVTKGQ